MSNKLVSIITRTKDRTIFIPRVFKTVIDQTYRPLQWIIVNDNGEDIRSIIDKLQSDHKQQLTDIEIILVNKEDSTTMEAATNTGLAYAEGFYLKILDDDDTLEIECTEKQVNYMENAKLPSEKGVISYTNIVEEEIENNTLKIVKKFPWKLHSPITISLEELAIYNRFTVHSFLYERSVFDTIEQYDESLPVLGDWDFNLRFLMHFDIGVLPEFLVNYHKRVENSPHQNTDKAHRKYATVIRNKYIRQVENTNMASLMLTSGSLRALNKKIDNMQRNIRELSKNSSPVSKGKINFSNLPLLFKQNYESADILREMAFLFEKKGDSKTALALMSEALNQRPTGQFILEKVQEYKASLKDS